MINPVPLEALSGLGITVAVAEIEHWIALDWLRPDGAPGHWRFTEIDVARLRLIVELRMDLGVDDTSLPVVLHVLDQLYEARRASKPRTA